MIQAPKTASQKEPAKGFKTPLLAPTHFYNPNKKTSNSMRLKSTSLTLAAAAVLAALPLANAQNVTATTDPVGFVTATVPVGISPLAVTLLNPDLLKTTATSVSSNSVALSGQTNVGSLLSAGEPYYIEVYSGSLKGDRFDVDTAATISAANGFVTLNATSTSNTYDVNSIASLLNNATVALRKHVTIEQLQSTASAQLYGNNSNALADQIQVYNNSDNTYTAYFLRGDGTTWRKVGTTISANKTPISPGTGVFIDKKSSSVTFTMTGSVRNNDFALPWKAGLQLVAPGFPIDTTPAGVGGTAANGWVGNNSNALADQIQVYNSATTAYDAYFLRGDGVTWRKVGTTTVVTSLPVATASQSFFVQKTTANSDNVFTNPLQ
ncbi:MAG: hypothetical protein EBY32_10110 [Proteobacteria bacterium]|nr:hypothetical protein [Pseudomonadota bacterium]